MSSALIVFAKAPVAGLAKTRLMGVLGPEGAARLAHRLLDHTVQQALAAGFERVELCVTPDTRHPAFERLQALSKGTLDLTLQRGADLGERMDEALSRNLKQHTQALLIGTDAPGLGLKNLQAAQSALGRHDAVFVPALDGGYVLVGLSRPAPTLFQGMAWSTPQVMAQTRLRARAAQLDWTELPPVADIDEPQDLAHLPVGWLP